MARDSWGAVGLLESFFWNMWEAAGKEAAGVGGGEAAVRAIRDWLLGCIWDGGPRRATVIR